MEFAVIFTEMTWVPALLLCLGILFLIIEVFVSGFGFFGISGIIMLVAGVIVRICYGLSITQALALILIILGIFLVLVMIMVYSAQYGVLGRVGISEPKSSIPQDYNELSDELKSLIGRVGEAITSLTMAGKANIDGEIYDVVAVANYIDKGRQIKVVEIKDNTIFVVEWFE